jgi:hypothetical protein
MLGHLAKAQQPMIAAAIRGIFQAASLAEAHQRLVEVVDRLQPVAPKVARLLEAAEADLLAFYAFPAEHWSKLRFTDERFKALVALSAGVGGVSLLGGVVDPGAKSRVLGLESCRAAWPRWRAV